MEPSNIEKQIREQLNARQINPSENSWDRLDAMLSVDETKKNKPSFLWWYIAASTVLFFSIGAFFYSNNDAKTNTATPLVVNEAPSTKEADDNSGATTKTINMAAPILGNNQSNTTLAIQNHKSFNSINQKNTIKTSVVTNLQTNQSEELQKAVVQSEKMPSAINLNKESIQTLNSNIPIVINTPKKVKVDANSLLSEVDGELNQAYRESKLDLIKRNFKAIRVAVANRNDQ